MPFLRKLGRQYKFSIATLFLIYSTCSYSPWGDLIHFRNLSIILPSLLSLSSKFKSIKINLITQSMEYTGTQRTLQRDGWRGRGLPDRVKILSLSSNLSVTSKSLNLRAKMLPLFPPNKDKFHTYMCRMCMWTIL